MILILQKVKFCKKKDIDLSVNFNRRRYSISEKSRKTKYNDILAEYKHIFDNGNIIKGWIYESEADILIYSLPDLIYEINMPQFKELMLKLITSIKGELSDFEKSQRKGKPISIKFQEKNINLFLTGAYNTIGNYTTYSICITPEDLKKFGINLKIFKKE